MEWKTDVILPTVSFTPLVLPSASTPDDLTALEMSKLTNTSTALL